MRIALRNCQLLALPFLLAAPIALGQIYVSPKGDDAHKGSAASPVRTLERAVELSRSAKDRRIVLRGGTYRLAQPLQLTAADSGTAGHDLVFTAAPGEHPILSGAVRIEHWQIVRSRAAFMERTGSCIGHEHPPVVHQRLARHAHARPRAGRAHRNSDRLHRSQRSHGFVEESGRH